MLLIPLAVFVGLQSLTNFVHRLFVARRHQHSSSFNVCMCVVDKVGWEGELIIGCVDRVYGCL